MITMTTSTVCSSLCERGRVYTHTHRIGCMYVCTKRRWSCISSVSSTGSLGGVPRRVVAERLRSMASLVHRGLVIPLWDRRHRRKLFFWSRVSTSSVVVGSQQKQEQQRQPQGRRRTRFCLEYSRLWHVICSNPGKKSFTQNLSTASEQKPEL